MMCAGCASHGLGWIDIAYMEEPMCLSTRRLVLGSVLVVVLAACGQPHQQSSGPITDIPVTLSASGDAAQGRLYFEGEGECDVRA